MSNYGQQPPYGQSPYGQRPGQQPSQQPPQQGQWGQPGPQQGQQPPPYGRPPQPGQNPYGQQPPPQNPYGQQPPPQNPYGQQPPQNPYGQPPQNPYGQQPQPQWVAQRTGKPTLVPRTIPVVTLDSLPGREVAEIVGEVIGVVARSRELPPDLRSGIPQEGYATMLTTSRQDAVSRLIEMAEAAGADAILGLRFDCSEITQSLSEVSAYGTAVKLVPQPGVEPTETGDTEEEPPATAPSSASEPARPGQWS